MCTMMSNQTEIVCKLGTKKPYGDYIDGTFEPTRRDILEATASLLQ